MELVADFLTSKFDSGLEYRTLNLYRSAISAYHEPVGGFPVGQHMLLTRLLKGMFNKRPPQPKYMDTWDVDLVLGRIRKWPDNEQLALRELSLKLVSLLALVSASRSSELHKFKISGMLDFGDRVEFHLDELTKGWKIGDPPIVVAFSQYDQEPKLDVIRCLRVYLERTTPLRKPGAEGDRLLISFRQPHGALASSSVARWIKTQLQESGIDVNKYQAHSTRSAATSKAKTQGLQTSQILARANWTRAQTFRRFYHKALTDDFQDKVLGEC